MCPLVPEVVCGFENRGLALGHHYDGYRAAIVDEDVEISQHFALTFAAWFCLSPLLCLLFLGPELFVG